MSDFLKLAKYFSLCDSYTIVFGSHSHPCVCFAAQQHIFDLVATCRGISDSKERKGIKVKQRQGGWRAARIYIVGEKEQCDI